MLQSDADSPTLSVGTHDDECKCAECTVILQNANALRLSAPPNEGVGGLRPLGLKETVQALFLETSIWLTMKLG